MKINPGNARGLLVPQGERPFSFVVYSSEIRDFGSNALAVKRSIFPEQNFTWRIRYRSNIHLAFGNCF